MRAEVAAAPPWQMTAACAISSTPHRQHHDGCCRAPGGSSPRGAGMLTRSATAGGAAAATCPPHLEPLVAVPVRAAGQAAAACASPACSCYCLPCVPAGDACSALGTSGKVLSHTCRTAHAGRIAPQRTRQLCVHLCTTADGHLHTPQATGARRALTATSVQSVARTAALTARPTRCPASRSAGSPGGMRSMSMSAAATTTRAMAAAAAVSGTPVAAVAGGSTISGCIRCCFSICLLRCGMLRTLLRQQCLLLVLVLRCT